MINWLKRTIVIGLLLTVGCKKVDDYLLGKDNTLSPTPLHTFKPSLYLNVDWFKQIGKNKSQSSDELPLKPIISQGIIYTAEPTGIVSAINSSTGSLRWQQKLLPQLGNGIATNKDYLAITTAKASLLLLDKTTGKLIWQRSVANTILGDPSFSDDKVIVKTIDGKLYAFDLNGKKIWEYDHGSPSLILKASSSPLIEGNLVISGFADGQLDVVDLKTGQLVWQMSVAYPKGTSDIENLVDIDSQPLIADHILYVATYQGSLKAFSLKTGKPLWKRSFSTYKNLALYKDQLIAINSNDVMYSFSQKKGKIQWKQIELKARNITTPAISDYGIIIGDGLGYLHILSLKDGRFLSRIDLKQGGISNQLLVQGHEVYVVTNNGILLKLTMKKQ